MFTSTEMLLKALAELIRQGMLTPATHIDDETFLCFKEVTIYGVVYKQMRFADLPVNLQTVFRYKPKGYEFGSLKIIAIFHIWEIEAQEHEVTKENENYFLNN